jgi:uncharacterized membrane protein YuzA (DUF378 family)
MKKLNVIDWIALILVLIGALNWGLIGFFKWDLVAAIFGDLSSVSRVIYALVGIAALWVIILMLPKAMKE